MEKTRELIAIYDERGWEWTLARTPFLTAHVLVSNDRAAAGSESNSNQYPYSRGK